LPQNTGPHPSWNDETCRLSRNIRLIASLRIGNEPVSCGLVIEGVSDDGDIVTVAASYISRRNPEKKVLRLGVETFNPDSEKPL